MGEEVFQLHVATPTYATHPVLSSTRCYFVAGVQEGLLSLLVCNRVYARGSSLPDGVSQGTLSLLVIHRIFSLLLLHKFPTLRFYHGNQTKAISVKTLKTRWQLWSRGHPSATVSTQIAQGFGRRSQKLVFKMAATVAILDFHSA